MFAILAFGAGAALAGLATPLLRRWAARRGLVDRPGGHKAHAAPVALGGGLAVTFAFAAPVLTALLIARLIAADALAWLPEAVRIHLGGVSAKTPMALAVVTGAAAMCALGFWDDLRPLPPLLKLLVEAAVALVLVLGFDVRLLSHLGGPLSAALTVLWIVGLINSMNFLDNMDGLLPGVALIVAAVFGLAAIRAGQVFVPVCCWLLAGALAAFLPHNLSPASIFLGDAGALAVGFLLAVLTVLTTFADPSQGQRPIGVLAPIVVMAVPLYDTLSVIYLRWRSGAPVWGGDRRHFSHRLVRRGMSARSAVFAIWLATLVTALPALLLPQASWPLAWGILVQTVLVVALVAVLEGRDTGG